MNNQISSVKLLKNITKLKDDIRLEEMRRETSGSFYSYVRSSNGPFIPRFFIETLKESRRRNKNYFNYKRNDFNQSFDDNQSSRASNVQDFSLTEVPFDEINSSDPQINN